MDAPDPDRPASSRRRGPAFVLIVVITLLIHGLSIHDTARSDQLRYLTEKSDARDFTSLVIRSYAHNRVMELAPGDHIRFHPLLYFLLGTEKWLFGCDFRWWQLTGLALHLAVIWSLMSLMVQIRAGLAAEVAGVMFATLHLGTEAFVWHHNHGVLVFLAFQLAAARHAWAMVGDPDPSARCFGAFIATQTIAAFALDPGSVMGFWLVLVIWLSVKPSGWRRRGGLVLCLLPGVAYFCLSAWDYQRRSRVHTEDRRIVSEMAQLARAGHALAAATWWTAAGLLGPAVDVLVAERLVALKHPFDLGAILSRPVAAVVVPAALGLVAVYLTALRRRGEPRSEDPNRLPRLVLLAGLPAGWAALLAIGRMNTRGFSGALMEQLHYTYMFWGLALPVALALLPPAGGRPAPARLRLAGVLLAAIWVMVNGLTIQSTNLARALYGHERSVLARAIDRIVAEHAHEPDFSLFVSLTCPGNFGAPWLARRGDPPMMCSFASAVWRPYCRIPDPKYILLAPNLLLQRQPTWVVQPAVR